MTSANSASSSKARYADCADQVWNRGISRGFGFSFYFDFVEPDKKKIAFSASFGHDRDFCNVQDRETISDT